jgi:L-alanine-DL-glutamate epimerase-like enolase superfamily enzyme
MPIVGSETAGLEIPVTALEASAYRIPTDAPEADGTLAWDSTVLVRVTAEAGGVAGWGYTYATVSAAHFIGEALEKAVSGKDALSPAAAWSAMTRAVRNQGLCGTSAMAISAVDNALWDLKARLLGCPLARLLGAVRPSIPVYGSGGFTSYDTRRLQTQLRGWVEQGMGRVKMKVGSVPDEDAARVAAARKAIGSAGLFVDANGAYARKQALELARRFAESGVTWFEEPLDAADVEGNGWLRDRLPAGMEIAGGEYGYRPADFLGLIRGGAVDVLQADATRCLGLTGFLKVSSLCEAFGLAMSSHCAPSLHLPLGCALAPMRHLEYFHDHVRIERMLFDGFREPVRGEMAPDPDRPGFGLEFREADAEAYRIR